MSTEQDNIRKNSAQRALRRPADDIAGKPNLRVKSAANRPASRMTSRPAGDSAAPKPVILAPAAAAAAIASAPTVAAAPAPAAAAVAPAAPVAAAPAVASPESAAVDMTPTEAALAEMLSAGTPPTDTAPAGTAPAGTAAAATIIVEPEAEAEAPVAPPALEEPAVAADDEPELMTAEEPRKAGKRPRIDPNREPSPYATHRPAPPDETAEQAQLAALTGQKVKGQERQISTGLLLGIGMILLLLVGGVMIARMGNHIRRLEGRITLLEQIHTRTAAAPRQR